MKLREIMTRQLTTLAPEATLVEAAAKMREEDIGWLPVCRGDTLLGVLTDRDIVMRGLAEHRDPAVMRAEDAMTRDVVYAFDDDDVEEATTIMKEHQVRRLLVLGRDKKLSGVVSLGDLSLSTDRRTSGEALRGISRPPYTDAGM
jgi:CBS domain-containing protein